MTVLRRLPATIYLLLIYGFIFLPIVVLVLFSFHATRVPVPPFQGPSLQWYGEIFRDRNLMEALGNSVTVALISSFISVVLGFLGSYALARYRLPGKEVWRWLLVAPLSVSYLIIAIGLLITFNMLSIPKSLFAVIIGHVVINLPLCFSIIYSQMGDNQANFEKAARDLGAKEWQVLLLISVPLLLPTIFAAFFLSITLSWDEFLIAQLVSLFDVTLPVEIWSLLKSGLNPKTNAVGSFVFAVSVTIVLLAEAYIFGRGRKRGMSDEE
jgi:spermidine/putrescine transport system permease protein